MTALSGRRTVTRRVILQKARDHACAEAPSALTAWTRSVSGTLSLPSPGYFSPFPHGTVRYRSRPVCSLGPWSARLPTGFRVSGGTRDILHLILDRAIRDCHPLWCGVPATSQSNRALGARKAVLAGGLTTPDTQRLLAWHASGLGIGPFRSPLLRAWYYLLRLLRCFSSPGSRSQVKPGSASPSDWRVAPFGNGWIDAWMPLPIPVAAVQRPSSAGRAEASSDRASCLAWSPVSSAARRHDALTRQLDQRSSPVKSILLIQQIGQVQVQSALAD